MKFMIRMSLCVLVLFSSGVNATTVLYKDFESLVDESDHVIGGTIKTVVAKKVSNGDIYTTVTITNGFFVSETGTVPSKQPIKIRYKGGEVPVLGSKGEQIGMEGIHTDGNPEFTPGQKVILFVSNNGVADMPIYGWQQGLFFVDDKNGVHDASDNPVVGLDGAHLVRKTPNGLTSNNQPVTTDKMLKEVGPAQLLRSEGGRDTLVDSKAINNAAVDKLGNYTAMDAANFESMVQERIAMKRNKTGKPEKDRSDMFVLPMVSNAQASASAHMGGNSGVMPPAMQGNGNGTPVLPLHKPAPVPQGE